MPFLESSFDLVISAFTLRSAGNLDIFLKEVHRVLADGGRVAFLDLTRPGKGVAALFFYPYLRRILPALGWIISGDRKAYRFLADSVCYFQTSDHTVKAMETAGFRNFQLKRFAFGAATLIIAAK